MFIHARVLLGDVSVAVPFVGSGGTFGQGRPVSAIAAERDGTPTGTRNPYFLTVPASDTDRGDSGRENLVGVSTSAFSSPPCWRSVEVERGADGMDSRGGTRRVCAQE